MDEVTVARTGAARLRPAPEAVPRRRRARPRRHRPDRRPQGQQALRRPGAARPLRARHRRRQRPDRPRRADHRHGRHRPPGLLGHHARAGRPGPHGPVRHALPGGGRRDRRPRAGAAPRPAARRRHGRRDQGEGGRPRVAFDLEGPIDEAPLRALPFLTALDISGQTVRIQSTDADATVHALYGLGVYPRNLEVAGLGLEQAFVAITAAEEAKQSCEHSLAQPDQAGDHPRPAQPQVPVLLGDLPVGALPADRGQPDGHARSTAPA